MNRSIGGFILYIATALYLFAMGIGGIFLGKSGGKFYGMVSVVLGGGGLTSVIAVIFAVCAIVAGVLLILQLFGMEFGLTEILMIAFCVLWALVILIGDILGLLRGSGGNFWVWLSALALDLMVLGSTVTATRAFGGN